MKKDKYRHAPQVFGGSDARVSILGEVISISPGTVSSTASGTPDMMIKGFKDLTQQDLYYSITTSGPKK